jgi:hypothetical protein
MIACLAVRRFKKGSTIFKRKKRCQLRKSRFSRISCSLELGQHTLTLRLIERTIAYRLKRGG